MTINLINAAVQFAVGNVVFGYISLFLAIGMLGFDYYTSRGR